MRAKFIVLFFVFCFVFVAKYVGCLADKHVCCRRNPQLLPSCSRGALFPSTKKEFLRGYNVIMPVGKKNNENSEYAGLAS